MSKPGFTVWLTGLSGAGKSTIAEILREQLVAVGQPVEVLDGDIVRRHLSQGLGYSREDRDINIRRIGWICELLNRHGVAAIVAAISPYRAAREAVRAQIPDFIEVYVECPIAILTDRDPKGLYCQALAGDIPHFTGISDLYEPPVAPDVICSTGGEETPKQSAAKVIQILVECGLVSEVAEMSRR